MSQITQNKRPRVNVGMIGGTLSSARMSSIAAHIVGAMAAQGKAVEMEDVEFTEVKKETYKDAAGKKVDFVIIDEPVTDTDFAKLMHAGTLADKIEPFIIRPEKDYFTPVIPELPPAPNSKRVRWEQKKRSKRTKPQRRRKK